MSLILRNARSISDNMNVLSMKINFAMNRIQLLLNMRMSEMGAGGGEGGPDGNCGPSMYDQRKYGHKLPTNNVCTYFNPLPYIPTGIFRPTDGEILGQGAAKCCVYKNPEYFSYHHMTYYDLHLLLRCYRQPCPETGRKP